MQPWKDGGTGIEENGPLSGLRRCLDPCVWLKSPEELETVEVRIPRGIVISKQVPPVVSCHNCGRPNVVAVIHRVNEPAIAYCEKHAHLRGERLLGEPLPGDCFR